MGAPSDPGTDCTLCRFMRGLAFGGIGAAVGGLGAIWLGAEQQTWIIAAFFGALIIGGLLNHRLAGSRRDGEGGGWE